MGLLAVLAALTFVATQCAVRTGQQDDAGWDAQRARMVDTQIRRRGVTDERVLDAMGRVPRHLFVPEAARRDAYEDRPLSIGYQQTISQPYIVGYMTALIEPKATDRVLEVGAGSGYQAAVLAEVVAELYTIEIIGELAARARATLQELGYGNVQVRTGDGYRGWPEAAPFDKIIVTAAPPVVPQALVDQLAVGGTLVVPVGPIADLQVMTILRRTPDGVSTEQTIPVRFVPMVPE